MENKWSLFQKFLITQNVDISIYDLLLNAALVVIMSLLLQFTYRVCGASLSNRGQFSQNFLLITFTTMLIISIVKSSLALSLGLVGALSIVRFRAAIKEPEELAYLFLSIAIGLGLGANQHIIVPIAFVIIMAIIWIRWFIKPGKQGNNLYFTISSTSGDKVSMSNVSEIIEKIFAKSELRRFDQNKDMIEVSYQVEVKSDLALEQCTKELQNLDSNIRISYINNHNL